MAQYDELIGLALAMYSHRGDGTPTQYVNPDGPAFATALTDLQAQLDMRDEVIAAQDERLNSLQAQVERLSGDGIHTCSDTCQRTACVLRREVTALQAQVAAGDRLAEALRNPTPDMWEAAWIAGEDYFVGDSVSKSGLDLAIKAFVTQALAQWKGPR